MEQVHWMDFVKSGCFGWIDIMKVCFELFHCEALTYLLIHHHTHQPTIKRLLHSSLVLLEHEIDHIPVRSYESVCFLHLIDGVFIVVGHDLSGRHAAICREAAQEGPHLLCRLSGRHLLLPNLSLPFAGEVLHLSVFS